MFLEEYEETRCPKCGCRAAKGESSRSVYCSVCDYTKINGSFGMPIFEGRHESTTHKIAYESMFSLFNKHNPEKKERKSFEMSKWILDEIRENFLGRR